MEPCVVPPGRRSAHMSGVESSMEACEWFMLPAFVIAACALCVNSVNGRAKQRLSLRPRECAFASPRCRRSPLAVAGLGAQATSPCVHAITSATTGDRTDRSGTCSRLCAGGPLSCTAGSLSPKLVGPAGSQRSSSNCQSGNDQALWRS